MPRPRLYRIGTPKLMNWDGHGVHQGIGGDLKATHDHQDGDGARHAHGEEQEHQTGRQTEDQGQADDAP